MREIAKDVFILPLMPRYGINCYLMEGVLVDAGIRTSARKILRNLRNFSVEAHALTHAHADHQGSTRKICQTLSIPLWTSEGERHFAESGKVFEEYPDKNHWIARFQRKYWAGKGYQVTDTFKRGDRIGTFTVIETPGHSSGHVSFFRESDGTLIAGDVMVNMNLLTTIPGLAEPPGLFTKNKLENRSSIQKIAELQPKIIGFGHGPILHNQGELEQFARSLV